MPSKGLVHHSGLRRPSDPPQEFYENAVRRVPAVREAMRQGNLDALEALETVTVLTGQARSLDPHTVAVDSGELVRVSAETVLVNAGSEPVWPPIPGLRESERIVASTALIESTRLPRRLTILGGGYLGIELAGIYRRFGSQVQLLEAASRLLAREDDDIAAAATAILGEEGIEILTGTKMSGVREEEGVAIVLGAGGRELSADRVLVAAGRRPVSGGLDLDAAPSPTPCSSRRRWPRPG